MITSEKNETARVTAVDAAFTDDVLHVYLSDGRQISLPMNRFAWLEWLRKASPGQRARWSLEPGGFAIYWDELDDGIEVSHLLATAPMSG